MGSAQAKGKSDCAAVFSRIGNHDRVMRWARTIATVLTAARVVMAADGLPAALVDVTSDVVHARTVVPDDVRAVGEVRLVQRGGATVVQTVLATKLLRRVVAEIAHKERGNWAPDQPGVDGMQRYVDAVEAAARELEAARDAAGGGGDRRLRLIIEFVATPDAAGVALATFDASGQEGTFETPGRQGMSAFPLPRPYVLRNMRRILSDAFHRPEGDVGALGPLGPAARP
jgi:hypothetical protein